MFNDGQLIETRWNACNKENLENHGYVFTKYNDKIVIRAKHLNPTSKKLVSVVCDYCGTEYTTPFSSYYKGKEKKLKSACSKCAGKKAQDINSKKRELKRINEVENMCKKYGYNFIKEESDLSNVKNGFVVFNCPKHGKQKCLYYGFVRLNHKCRLCSYDEISDNRKLPYNFVKSRVEENGTSILLNPFDYKNEYESNLIIKCLICGEVNKTSLSNFRLLSTGCPNCGIKKLSSIKLNSKDKVENIINSNKGNILINKEDYINNMVKNLKITCSSCGNVFVTSLGRFQSGKTRCNKCSNSESNGEYKIRQVLTKYGVKFESQKKFDDCIDKKPLPFDFYLPDYNICIEFQGLQHYKAISYFGKEKGYEYRTYHDRLKYEYCKNNNIKLIYIKYDEEKNIDNIILNIKNNYTKI